MSLEIDIRRIADALDEIADLLRKQQSAAPRPERHRRTAEGILAAVREISGIDDFSARRAATQNVVNARWAAIMLLVEELGLSRNEVARMLGFTNRSMVTKAYNQGRLRHRTQIVFRSLVEQARDRLDDNQRQSYHMADNPQ